MCGIMAYIGQQEAYPILVNGLKKLEYRGYDSSGVALMNGTLSLLKKEGKVADLENYAQGKKTAGNIGLGHTRWATHGIPSDINAHPHQCESGRYTIVHNGIIENYQSLKEMLIDQGYFFKSDTDTEVLVQLIDWQQKTYNLDTRSALARSLEMVEGSFAIVLFDLFNPTSLWVAKRQSPLVIGLGKGEFYFSSDVMPLASLINKVIYMEDDTIAEASDNGQIYFFDLFLNPVQHQICNVEKGEYDAEKGNFDSFMLKEIFEQPQSVLRLINKNHDLSFEKVDRIIITACGTSWHSGLMAKYLIEQYAKLPVSVEYASEFRYRNPVLGKNDMVVGISQSGETADTIAALELAKANQCQTLALVNVPNSTIDRITDNSIYLEAGPEIGVASTKAFTNQIIAITKLLIMLINDDLNVTNIQLKKEFAMLSDVMNKALDCANIEAIVNELCASKNALFLGRGPLFPVALEGALKLKEVSYIHAEGYAAGEMKHGPIALVDDQMPIIALCQNDKHLPKMISNIQEVKARKGVIIIIKSTGFDLPDGLADYTLEIENDLNILSPLVMNIPLQLIAHGVATQLGLDVDKPRNLAKSVTVE